MITKISTYILPMAASLALALSGCGGGGGSSSGGSSGGGAVPMAPVTRTQALENSETVAASVADAIGRAADAQPRPGSVTQSSEVDNNNITTDQVEITAEYESGGPSFSVRNGTTWSIGMGEGNPSRISDTTSPWQGAELRKRITGGTLYVDAYTDIQAPETQQVGGANDGTRDVPLGTMIQSAGFTSSSGGTTSGLRGTLDGETGTFNCTGSGGCGVTNGTTTRGMWTFTPDRPPGAVDVSSSDTVAWTGTFNTSRLTGMHNGEQGHFKCLSQSCGRRTSTVNGQTQMMLTGDWIFVPSTGTTITTPDTDYLAGGVWLIVPDDTTSANDYVFGAFADGNDPFRQNNLTALQSTATYDGDATGLYSEKMSGSTIIGYFDGDVRLTANFDGGENDRGTISGSITNFEVDGDSVDDAWIWGLPISDPRTADSSEVKSLAPTMIAITTATGAASSSETQRQMANPDRSLGRSVDALRTML